MSHWPTREEWAAEPVQNQQDMSYELASYDVPPEELDAIIAAIAARRRALAAPLREARARAGLATRRTGEPSREWVRRYYEMTDDEREPHHAVAALEDERAGLGGAVKLLRDGRIPTTRREGVGAPELEPLRARQRAAYQASVAEMKRRHAEERSSEEGWQRELANRKRLDDWFATRGTWW